MTHTEHGLDTTSVQCFREERDELLHDEDCVQLASLGLVRHVTEMGMTPEELKHGILECRNCVDCQQVGMVHE